MHGLTLLLPKLNRLSAAPFRREDQAVMMESHEERDEYIPAKSNSVVARKAEKRAGRKKCTVSSSMFNLIQLDLNVGGLMNLLKGDAVCLMWRDMLKPFLAKSK